MADDTPRRRGRPTLDPAGLPAEKVSVGITRPVNDAACKGATAQRESLQDLIRRGIRREIRRAIEANRPGQPPPR